MPRPARVRAGRAAFVLACLVLAFGLAPGAFAAGGPLGIDHRITYDDSGIWGKAHQNQVLIGTGLFVAASALWEGNDSRFGHTMWQSGDAIALALAGDFVLSNTFQRQRPEDTADPNRWFQGFGNTSFPSGHAMISSAAVTPIVLEYGSGHPWVWALEAIPLYEGVGRLKTQAHWQTDVLAGTVSLAAVRRLVAPALASVSARERRVGREWCSVHLHGRDGRPGRHD